MGAVWLDAKVLDNADQDNHDTRHDASLLALVEVLELPEWHADALCREYPAEWWFPGRSRRGLAEAVEVCSRCLVVGECRAAALADRNAEGIWGATTTNSRKKMRQQAS